MYFSFWTQAISIRVMPKIQPAYFAQQDPAAHGMLLHTCLLMVSQIVVMFGFRSHCTLWKLSLSWDRGQKKDQQKYSGSKTNYSGSKKICLNRKEGGKKKRKQESNKGSQEGKREGGNNNVMYIYILYSYLIIFIFLHNHIIHKKCLCIHMHMFLGTLYAHILSLKKPCNQP